MAIYFYTLITLIFISLKLPESQIGPISLGMTRIELEKIKGRGHEKIKKNGDECVEYSCDNNESMIVQYYVGEPFQVTAVCLFKKNTSHDDQSKSQKNEYKTYLGVKLGDSFDVVRNKYGVPDSMVFITKELVDAYVISEFIKIKNNGELLFYEHDDVENCFYFENHILRAIVLRLTLS